MKIFTSFVSWALYHAGLPQSRASGATFGWFNGTATSWPSNSWMRTGFNPPPPQTPNAPNGVTDYVVQRGWFFPTYDHRVVMAGSIKFWRNTSHVAFVTSGNQQHVYFAENGQWSDGRAGGSSSRNRRFDPAIHNSRFYVPNQQTLRLIP